MANRTTPPPPARVTRKMPPGQDVRSIGRSDSSDIGFDRVVGPDEAGLGDELDEAEEAQLGATDEDLDARGRGPRRSL